MNTNAFRGFSAKYGLDSEIVASFCESFATHVDLPKEKWFKYRQPVEQKIEEPVIIKNETIVCNVDPVVPTDYIEKPHFLVRMKEHAKVSTVVKKVILGHTNPKSKLKLNLIFLWLKISWPIISMGMLFTSVMKLLELLDLVLKINIDLL